VGFGIKGYAIASHWRNDRIGPKIANWKDSKLPERGRFTYLDDV
jgi:hypothetical protein